MQMGSTIKQQLFQVTFFNIIMKYMGTSLETIVSDNHKKGSEWKLSIQTGIIDKHELDGILRPHERLSWTT